MLSTRQHVYSQSKLLILSKVMSSRVVGECSKRMKQSCVRRKKRPKVLGKIGKVSSEDTSSPVAVS